MGADLGQVPTPRVVVVGGLYGPKWLHGTMCFAGARGAGYFVLGT